jgi:hypothetical protein
VRATTEDGRASESETIELMRGKVIRAVRFVLPEVVARESGEATE